MKVIFRVLLLVVVMVAGSVLLGEFFAYAEVDPGNGGTESSSTTPSTEEDYIFEDGATTTLTNIDNLAEHYVVSSEEASSTITIQEAEESTKIEELHVTATTTEETSAISESSTFIKEHKEFSFEEYKDFRDSAMQVEREVIELQEKIQRLIEEEVENEFREQQRTGDILHQDEIHVELQQIRNNEDTIKSEERILRLKEQVTGSEQEEREEYRELHEHRRKIIEETTSQEVRKESVRRTREILQKISVRKEDILESVEDPRTSGDVFPQVFEVVDITAKETVVEEEEHAVGTKGIVVKGVGPPNSVVVLYIFSTPVIVTVHTDENGSWEYNLTRELEDGQHEVHVASVDNSGKILAKSEPFIFFKNTAVAQAAEISFEPPSLPIQIESEPNFWRANFLWISLVMLSILVMAAVVLLGSLRKKSPNAPNS